MALMKIPKKLPLLLVQDDILLPGSTMRVPINGSSSLNLVKSRLLSRNSLTSSIIGVVTVEDIKLFEENINNPDATMLGTAAFVLQVTGSVWPKSNTVVLCLLGVCRFLLDKLVMVEPYPVGVVTQIDYLSSEEDAVMKPECLKMAEEIRKFSLNILNKMDPSNASVSEMKRTVESVPMFSLPDLAMALSHTSYAEKREILFNLDLEQRMRKVLPILHKQLEEISQKKETEVAKTQTAQPTMIVVAIPKNHQTLRVGSRNRNELLDASDNVNETDELQNKIAKANLPAEVNRVVSKDLQRLRRMGPFSPEHGIIRSYIEYVVELPWTMSSSETIDIPKARKDLDADHYGMDKVKQRVLEYLAVRQLKSSVRGPVLCFVGPPGVGKTSIGRSIAHTLGRQFQRISLGGVSNQSEIRGHRRTYIGAMPGRILQAIKNAGVNNPVILLDEIDKMTQGIHGDPAAALLEVLDPLQNSCFLDHYLNVPFDLSQVTFIATANESRRIPAPLLDRMETISVSGYTMEEKVHIAMRHLLPKQIKENGLESNIINVPEDSLEQLIRNYTAEAGVRNLERNIGAVCRAVAVKVAEHSDSLHSPIEVSTDVIEETLGPPVYCELDVWSRVGAPGVAVGLSWTVGGGSLLLVEATKLEKGSGKLTLTGQLGTVMQESARLALNWVRSVANQFGLVREGEELMSDIDVHIHFPQGAVSKEGPSAGVTIAMALVSLFANVPLISGLAMSGELTLRGFVLPVGGVREKVLAAHRAGFKKVILPKLCIKDLFYIPQKVKDEMSFLFVNHMEEVIEAGFDSLVIPVSQTPTLQSRL